MCQSLAPDVLFFILYIVFVAGTFSQHVMLICGAIYKIWDDLEWNIFTTNQLLLQCVSWYSELIDFLFLLLLIVHFFSSWSQLLDSLPLPNVSINALYLKHTSRCDSSRISNRLPKIRTVQLILLIWLGLGIWQLFLLQQSLFTLKLTFCRSSGYVPQQQPILSRLLVDSLALHVSCSMELIKELLYMLWSQKHRRLLFL